MSCGTAPRRAVIFSLTGSFAILWLLLAIEPLDRNTWPTPPLF